MDYFNSSLRSSLLRCSMAMFLFVGAPIAANADSHADGSPSVDYRQKVMSAVGANMGGIGDILKNGLEMPGHVANHAAQIAENAKLVAAAFKKNAPSTATDAKPEIWKDWAEFEAAIDDMEKAARNLEAAASGPDAAAIGPAVKALGKSCGGCHKVFRKPKEESYKMTARGRDKK